MNQTPTPDQIAKLTGFAQKGIPDTQIALGILYENGDGVPQSHETAVGWYCKAAEQENAFGQFLFRRACYMGRGTTRDLATGLKFTQLAAEQGNEEAANFLKKPYVFTDT